MIKDTDEQSDEETIMARSGRCLRAGACFCPCGVGGASASWYPHELTHLCKLPTPHPIGILMEASIINSISNPSPFSGEVAGSGIWEGAENFRLLIMACMVFLVTSLDPGAHLESPH